MRKIKNFSESFSWIFSKIKYGKSRYDSRYNSEQKTLSICEFWINIWKNIPPKNNRQQAKKYDNEKRKESGNSHTFKKMKPLIWEEILFIVLVKII